VPTYKEPEVLQSEQQYPLQYNTPHGRWSIHSTWRDNKHMLRLQRGEPIVYMHPDDADERGIEDGDTVRIYNDLDEIEVSVKIYPSAQPGVAKLYFAWERFQFPSRGNFNTLVGMYMKPTQLVQYPADSGEHLEFVPNYWGPTGVNSDVQVEVELADGEPTGEGTAAGNQTGGSGTPMANRTAPNANVTNTTSGTANETPSNETTDENVSKRSLDSDSGDDTQ
jgi:complex iron-sulfur molybdoenzyme family reductase subunit alpha